MLSGNHLLTGFLVGILAIATGTAVYAAGDKDYQDGRAAYERGDLIAAMEHLNRAVEQGNVSAMSLLGYVLDKSEENEAAAKMYRRAADLGDGEALLALGSLYANGEGVEKNVEKAVQLIEQSAQEGYGPAIMVLASAYSKGDLGLQVDQERARLWLRQGVSQGYEPAKTELERLEKTPQ